MDKVYHIVFKNKFAKNADPETVKGLFVSRYKISEKACHRIFSGRRVRIKKSISQQKALHLQDELFKIGMLCDIELDTSSEKSELETKHIETKKECSQNQKIRPTKLDHDDDEDEDDDFEADFDLSEILCQTPIEVSENNQSKKTVIEIIKQHENNIVDIHYLDNKQNYCDTDRRFCLVEQKGSKAFFYYNDFIYGKIITSDGNTMDTQSICDDDHLFHKKQRIFRNEIPEQGYVTLTDDRYTYHIQKQIKYDLPPSKAPKSQGAGFFKHFSRSVICHLIIVLVIGGLLSFKPSEPEKPKRFASIAGNKIHDLQKIRKIRKQPLTIPKKEIVKVSPEKPIAPVKQVIKMSPAKKVAPQKTVAALKKSSPRRSTSKKSSMKPSRGNVNKTIIARGSSTKGTGNGGGPSGNVSTPNVHQKGLLGLLKDTGLSLLPNDALAAVTQLDTVDVPGSFQKNTLKINGIKGNLGDTKIQIPGSSGGGRVNTKSEHQVLRTGGGDGSGGGHGSSSVGELAKGNTGNHAVKAMIQANFNQSVQHVQGGGISRTAVKKVIDQHIDDITYCYEVALISDPSIIGKAVYEWRILMNGSVGEVHIANASLQNQQILSCIKKSIKSWDFPKPHLAEVMVSYPFVFDIVGF